MEAVTAVGVASAAVQFLDFSMKTLALCKEIRDSSDGSTKDNNDLTRYIKQLKAMHKDLQQKGFQTSSSHRQLIRTVQDCSRVADELLALLEHIRNVAQKAFGTMRAALRTMKEGKRIERLQTRLSDCQGKLHLALTAELRDTLLQQFEDQGKITASLRVIISQGVDSTHDRLRELDANVNRSAGSIQKQISSACASQQRSQADLKRGQQNLEGKVDSHFSTQEFLNKLSFRGMNWRQETMKSNLPGTYDWVFSGKSSHQKDLHMTPKKRQEDGELRSRIVHWLSNKGEHSMFWISGKPGSGKSSLSSYIINDPRTAKSLQQWAGSHKPHFFSFFFWKPGSSLQKSIIGFRRSLLCQLCNTKPLIIQRLLSRDPTLLCNPLTGERVLDALKVALSFYHDEAVLYVIDGLDECEDNHSDLLDEILEMKFGPRAKICVSSRPEEAIRRRLDKLPCIRLQDLNREDIFDYARTKLMRGGDRTVDLALDVTKAAEGVFLWAVLVCDSLCSGAMAEDSAETLLERLHSYPKGLDDLFDSMFASIDKLHHRTLAFYFYSARQRLVSVALAVASNPASSIKSLEQFGALCEREITRITTQSKGLLEIKLDEDYERCGTCGWSLRSLPDRLDGRPTQHRLGDGEFRSMFRHTNSYIQFVHRSAYDYIFDNTENISTAWTHRIDTDEIVGKVVNGALWLAEYGLVVYMINGELRTVSLRENMIRVIAAGDLTAVNEKQICEGLSRLSDAHYLWDSANAVSNYANLLHDLPDDKWSRSSILRPLRLFWSDALRIKPEFVLSHLPRIWHRNDTYLNIMHLLQSWSSERYSRIRKQGHVQNLAIHSAMHSAMAKVKVRGRADFSVMEFPYHDARRRHLGTVERTTAKTNQDWSFISWYGTDLPLEPAIVDRLKQTAYMVARENVQERPIEVVHAGPVNYSEFLEISILEGICTTIDTWQLFSGSYISSSGKPLPLQLSLPMLHRYPPAYCQSNGIAPDHLLSYRPNRCLRLSCFAKRGPDCLQLPKAMHQPANAIATYHVSIGLSDALMGFCVNDNYGYAETRFVGSWTERSSYIEMVMTELWNDPEDQLTAWQQLYLRACVKSYFARFWKEQMNDWPTRKHW